MQCPSGCPIEILVTNKLYFEEIQLLHQKKKICVNNFFNLKYWVSISSNSYQLITQLIMILIKNEL